MKTIEMEVALMKELNPIKNVVIPNISWGMYLCNKGMHECDLLSLSSNGFATEVEIKVSKSDLLKDFEKKHKHDHPAIKYLYYAVPKDLEAIASYLIPETAGLYVVDKLIDKSVFGKGDYKFTVRQFRKATARKPAYAWTLEERLKLYRLGCIRVYTLKSKILQERNSYGKA